jgi:hypothetical protein
MHQIDDQELNKATPKSSKLHARYFDDIPPPALACGQS